MTDPIQMGEGFAAQVTHGTVPEPTQLAAPQTLTAADLAMLLCRVPWVNPVTGEQGEIILSEADWQRWLTEHRLTITRSV